MSSEWGRELRAYRETLLLSQSELARRAGISQSTISRWENGSRPRPFASTMRKVRDVFRAEQERLNRADE